MDIATFRSEIAAEGFAEPVRVVREANGSLDVHTHPFEAKALILEGSIEIGLGGRSQEFGPGEVFHLEREAPHWERYGPAGVVYLSARREG